MQQQQVLSQQQQNRIQQLEASAGEQDRKVVYKPRETTLKLYQELLNEPKFFDSELPKDHDAFDWNNYHYTEGMNYKPPPVLQHSEVSLTDTAKRHGRDLVSIQGYLAHTTRFYDTFCQSVTLDTTQRPQILYTFAHEIIKDGESKSTFGKRMLGFLNTVRISTSHDAFRISRMRENLYHDELGGIPFHFGITGCQKKPAADLVRKTYKKYEPPKDKTKKPDNKSTKDTSGTGDKSKDHQLGKSRSKDKSGYKSDSGNSGDGGKSDGKPRYKSGDGQGRKQSDKGNDREKSD
ncbi:hypothetical protein EC957_005109 [Mortierella hygrophila]|uniref:Uncharacterized protein n=1 Tax=Mortierella hygrophila TaxID=979708 RepID=A0A9P6EZS6_9FUNG|nr:hypothetical protein EC957_005109 [Mortierella hygrophila]